MRPGIDPREGATKQRARIGLLIYWVVATASTALLSGTRFSTWRWMPGILGITGSYLLSAPRLLVMMWAREVLRRARLGPRRPG